MLKLELKELINNNILVKKDINDNFHFTNNDGSWIFDFRRGFLVGELLEKFCIFFWDKYENIFPFQVGGLELGSVPFISGIIYEGRKRGYNVNSFIVRKQRKLSGLGNQIEGILNNEKIIIVDDLVNTGTSLFFISDILKTQENRNVYKYFVFVNFGRQKLNSYFREYKDLLDYEFTLSDFGLADYMDNKSDSNYPLIFPSNKILYSLKNPNKFLEAPKSNPLKFGKNIIFGGEGGTLVSLCSDTGNLNFTYKINPVSGHKNILSSPLLFENKIFFGGYDGTLHCIDSNTGNLKWKFIDSEWIGSSPCISEKQRSVFIGLEHGGRTNKGSLASINLDTGLLNWQIIFDDYVHCSPEYNEKFGLVICGGNDGKLVCVRSDNGKIIYERNFNAPIKGGFSFSQDSKYVFFGCFDGYIYGLDILYGNLAFKYKTNDIVYSKPLILGDNLFFGSLDKYFYHYDLIESKLVKKVKTYGKIFSQPIFISGNLIAFGSNDSTIYFYNYSKGNIEFIINHKERISTNLIFDELTGCLYVNDFLNNMYKYDIKKFIK